MILRKITTVALIAVAMTGCATNPYGPKQTVGTLAGAALGGLLGAQFGAGAGRLAATGAGVLIGGLIGSELGRNMDAQDRRLANAAIRRSYDSPLGDPIYWRNPDNGNSGSITPLREGNAASGRYCREYRQTITIDGRQEIGTGIACRQTDGTWRIVQR